MKQLISFAIIALMAVSCGALRETPQEEAAMASYVASAVANDNIEISITYIYPQSGPGISSINEYSLAIKDGRVTTRLPFRGTASMVNPFKSDNSIVFEDQPVDIKKTSDPKKGKYSLYFEAKCEEERWTVQIDVFDNGKSYITCKSLHSSLMRYDGEVTVK